MLHFLRYVKQLMANDVIIKVMETFLDVLQPFVQITELVGAKKSVTLLIVRPLLYNYKVINKHFTSNY